MEDRSGTTPTALPFTVALGQRLLEVQEERVVLIVDRAQGTGRYAWTATKRIPLVVYLTSKLL